MVEIAQRVLLLLFAASVGEGVIEFIFSPALDALGVNNLKIRTVVLNITSAALGVVIALGFRLEMFALLGGVGQFGPIDSVLTGLAIGRGSNWLHGLLTQFFLNAMQTRANIDESFAQAEYYTKNTPPE